ncbi:MAG: hypothetical protein EYC68_18345 [Chloroflexota bacterium]|nr:MAG: hypothetical protein EYC68_18345 [Chloroflexota bacterium]
MAYGPVQYFVFDFPGNQFKGEIVPALQDVVAKGYIRIVDIAFATKDADGNIASFELNDLPDDTAQKFGSVIHSITGMLSDEDIAELSSQLPPNSSAALLVFEHVWAKDLADAIRNANGITVAQGFVPHNVVEEVMQARAQAAN